MLMRQGWKENDHTQFSLGGGKQVALLTKGNREGFWHSCKPLGLSNGDNYTLDVDTVVFIGAGHPRARNG